MIDTHYLYRGSRGIIPRRKRRDRFLECSQAFTAEWSLLLRRGHVCRQVDRRRGPIYRLRFKIIECRGRVRDYRWTCVCICVLQYFQGSRTMNAANKAVPLIRSLSLSLFLGVLVSLSLFESSASLSSSRFSSFSLRAAHARASIALDVKNLYVDHKKRRTRKWGIKE